MEFSEEELAEFKEVYEEETGEHITEIEALEIAQRLLRFLLLIYRPLPEGNKKDKEDHGLNSVSLR